MKKVLVVLLVALCALSLAFGGCNLPKAKNQNGKNDAPQAKVVQNEVAETISFQSVTALQSADKMGLTGLKFTQNVSPLALTGGDAVENPENNGGEVSEPQGEAVVEEPQNQEGVIEEKLQDIISSADIIANPNANIVILPSDREGYELKSSLVYGGINCTIYINVIESKEEIEEPEEEGEEQEIEISNEYEGIIIFNNSEYAFYAETVVEREGDEVEEEIKLEIKIAEGTYIIIEQEFEVEGNEREESFVYKFYENNVLIDNYKISKEVEGNEGELKIVKNGEVFKYKYFIEDEVEYIQIINDTITEVYKKVLDVNGRYTFDVVEDANQTPAPQEENPVAEDPANGEAAQEGGQEETTQPEEVNP